MKPATPKRSEGWRQAAEVAEIFGVSRPNVCQVYQPLLPAESLKRVGNQVFLHVPTLISIWVDRQVEAAGADMAGPDSPNLERYRAAKADREEMRRDTEAGTHVAIADIDELINSLASAIKSGVEQLQRKYGPSLADEFNEILADFQEQWNRTQLARAIAPAQPATTTGANSTTKQL